jgi:hypothetical protein
MLPVDSKIDASENVKRVGQMRRREKVSALISAVCDGSCARAKNLLGDIWTESNWNSK